MQTLSPEAPAVQATPASKRPLTVAEALRNIAAEEAARRRLESLGSAKYHSDCLGAEPILHPLHELQQHWPQVGV